MNKFRPLSRSHNNLITIVDDVQEPIPMNEDESVGYILMEGGDHNLERVIGNSKKVNPKKAIKVIKDISNALDAVYKEGYIHRDIKSSNIIVAAGTYKLCDFNTMVLVDDESGASLSSQSSFAQGTKHYFAPELNMANEAGNVDLPARDIYSLGITLYQIITGTTQNNLFKLNYNKKEDEKPKTNQSGREGISRDEYRKLQRNPVEFFKYLGISDEPNTRKSIPDNLFLFKELTKNFLFYDPSKQAEWEDIPAKDPRKLSGPETPWHLRPQNYEEVNSLVQVFDNFDLMMEVQKSMNIDIQKNPGDLLKSFGKGANDKKGLWHKINQLRW